jgi:hypothetical protein
MAGPMSEPHRQPIADLDPRARAAIACLVAALIGAAIVLRVMRLSSVPGVSGDEGWWGIQALAWLAGRPYEARTTSGNPIDLLLLVPLGLLHGVAPPSFLLLRVIPAAANLLALAAGYWFVRRLYGTTTAWVYTVGLAILPTAIVHSRICQDPSQSIFWSGLVVYLALLGREDHGRAWAHLLAALLVLPLALWTHPTNVFVVPFLLVPVTTIAAPLLPGATVRRAQVGVAAVILLAAVAWFARLAIAPLVASNESLDKPWLAMAAARLVDGAQWVEFAANGVRLLNGVTVYHYFSGARPLTWPHDVGVAVVAGVAAWGLFAPPAARRGRRDLALLAASAGTWLLFFAFAGPVALRPHAERWGLGLIVPAMLVLARGVGSWIDDGARLRVVKIVSAGGVAAAVLTSFHTNYFREFATTGGRSHRTYVTAPTEPKRQALEHILSRTGESGAMIVAASWWLRMPMAYLASAHPTLSVSGTPLDVSIESAGRRRFFVVEFANTPELEAARERLRSHGLEWNVTTIRDAGGRPLIEILEVGP